MVSGLKIGTRISQRQCWGSKHSTAAFSHKLSKPTILFNFMLRAGSRWRRPRNADKPDTERYFIKTRLKSFKFIKHK